MRHLLALTLFALLNFLLARLAIADTCDGVRERVVELLSYNHCKTSRDCGAVHLPEPYGCNRTINKDYLGEIEELREVLALQCESRVFNCRAHTRSIWCRKGVCDGRVELDRRYPSVTKMDQYGRTR